MVEPLAALVYPPNLFLKTMSRLLPVFRLGLSCRDRR